MLLRSRLWERSSFSKPAPEQQTGFFRATIEEQDADPMCRVRDKDVESVGHVPNGCTRFAQSEYRRRHEWMGLRVYWELCRKYGVKCADVWYKEVPDVERMSGDGNVEIWWGRCVGTTREDGAARE